MDDDQRFAVAAGAGAVEIVHIDFGATEFAGQGGQSAAPVFDVNAQHIRFANIKAAAFEDSFGACGIVGDEADDVVLEATGGVDGQ